MFRFAATVSVVCAIALNLPASAQTPPASAPAKAPTSDPATNDPITTVTVTGLKRRPRDTFRMDISRASSCGFANAYNSADDPMVQGYLDNFYGSDHPDDPSADSSLPTDDPNATPSNRRIQDNSPYGNAATNSEMRNAPVGADNSQAMSRAPGGCGPADTAFAAGRNFILRMDHSLTDAYAAFDAGDYTKALDLFKKSYNKIGYDQAAYMIGKMYLAGIGTERDTPKAITWLKKVAEGRTTPGQEQRFDPKDPYYMSTQSDASMTLAKIYLTGWDVPKDPKEARKWYARADVFGYVPAGYILGQFSQKGIATDKSMTKAISYFKKAGQLGFAPAQYELGMIYYNGEDGVAQDQKEGAKWLMAAASGGHTDALYAVGRMYDLGETLPQDSNKAVVYYKDAATKGQADAQTALGTYFYSGEIVGKDLAMARKWFEQGAQRGSADGMFNLAVMLVNGEGGEKNLMLAYVWLKLAALSGLEKATAAAAEIEPQLTADDRVKAEAILNPPAK